MPGTCRSRSEAATRSPTAATSDSPMPRCAARRSSGTPCRQGRNGEASLARPIEYAVLGISEPSNTRALFDTAAGYGVRHLLDDDCSTTASVDPFLDAFLGAIDVLYLTI